MIERTIEIVNSLGLHARPALAALEALIRNGFGET